MIEVLVIHRTLYGAEELRQYITQCYEECHVTICADENALHVRKCIEELGGNTNVCFTKIRMSGCSGMQVAQELRKKNAKVKIVFLSDTDEYALDAWKLGINDYLLEPITQEKIKNSIENL